MANVIEFTIRGVDKFSGTMGKVSRTLGVATKATAAVTGAVAAAATGFALFVNRTAEAEDRAGKFAQRLGENVEELTALQFAADQSGVSVNTLNLAVQRSTRRISEAAQGSGEAVNALKELGLEAKELSNLPLEQRMAKIADAFEGVENNSTRTRLAFKLFDSEGVAMIQMLENGSGAMQKMAEDARFLGAVITQQAAANAAEFTNETGRLRAALEGVSREIGDTFIPIMTGMTRASANALAGMREGVGRVSEVVLRGLVGAWIAVGQIIERTKEQINSLSEAEGWDNLIKTAFDVFIGILRFAGRTAKDSAAVYVKFLKLAFNIIIDSAKSAFSIILEVVTSAAIIAGKGLVLPFVAAFDGVVAIAKQAWKNIVSIFKGEEGKPLGETFINAFMESARDSVSGIQKELNDIYSTIPSLGGFIFGALDNATVETARKDLMDQIADSFGNIGDRSSEAGQRIAEGFGVNMKEVNAEIDRMIEGLEVTGTAGIRTANEVSSAMQRTQSETGKTAESMKVVSQEAIAAALEVSRSVTEFYSEAALVVDDLTRDLLIEFAKLQAELRITSQDIAKGITSVVRTMHKETTDVFFNILKGGIGLREGMKSIFSAMVDDILRQIARLAANKVFSILLDFFVGKTPSGGGSGIGGGGGGNIGSTLGTIAGSFFGPIGGAIGNALGGLVGGLFHGGISTVPREGLSMLSSGERVLSRDQNEDFTRMLQNGGMGGGMAIEHASFHFFENATGSDVMLKMSREDWRELVARKIIPAVNDLEKSGVRQLSIERTGQ